MQQRTNDFRAAVSATKPAKAAAADHAVSGPATPDRSPSSVADRLLALQSQVGNNAVAKLIENRSLALSEDAGLETEAGAASRSSYQAPAVPPAGDMPSGQAVGAGPGLGAPVQLITNRNKKRLLNVASFGIRKAVTTHRKNKARRAQEADEDQAAREEQEARDDAAGRDPVDAVVEAYGKSRYYHQSDAVNLPSIEQHGLMNYADRIDTFDEDVLGMSSIGGGRSEFAGDERKGVFLGDKKFMQENKMTTRLARGFLSSDRTPLSPASMEETVPDHELFRDSKFPGAVITKASIPSDLTTTGPTTEILNQGGPKSPAILDAIGSHYRFGAPPSEELEGHLREAILRRRVSDAAMDNIK